MFGGFPCFSIQRPRMLGTMYNTVCIYMCIYLRLGERFNFWGFTEVTKSRMRLLMNTTYSMRYCLNESDSSGLFANCFHHLATVYNMYLGPLPKSSFTDSQKLRLTTCTHRHTHKHKQIFIGVSK